MKSLVIALTVLFSIITKSGSATEKDVTPVVLASFQNTFTAAKEVDWSVSENFYKAQFVLNGQYVTAYYSSDGSMEALTRNISLMQLPVTLQAGLKKASRNYWISDLFELTIEGNTQYYITLENAGEKVVLKSSNADWSPFQESRK